MRQPCLYIVLLATMLMRADGETYAQQRSRPETVWRKTITRNVELAAKKKDTIKLAGNKTKEITLTETLVNEIRAGRLPAYSNIDHDFSTRLRPDDNNYTINPQRDTVEVTDPVTNKSSTRVRVTDLNVDAVHTYRTLEEWTFNPATNNTEIHITGIAPIRDVYGDDGALRGVQAMFWIKYADAIGIIMKYEKEHPKNPLLPLIWNDNFNDSMVNGTHAMALRNIDFNDNSNATVHHLKDAGPEEAMTEIINDLIKKGEIPVYSKSDYSFASKIPQEKVKEMAGLDTMIMVDPVNGATKQIVRERDNYLSDNCGIIEQWDFDTQNGRMGIKVIALAAYNHIYANNQKTTTNISLIIKPADIQTHLYAYSQYHPTATFANKVWDSYFLSDTKPEIIK